MSLVHPPLHSVHLNALRPTPPARAHLAFMDAVITDIAHGVGVPVSMLPTPGECLGRAAPLPVPSLNSHPSTLNRGVLPTPQ